MRRVIVTIVLLILLFSGYKLTVSSQNGEPGATETHEILNNAVFTDLDGEEITLMDFRGKTILIDIWETWCTPCIVSMPTLQRLMDDYPDDFVVLAVSPAYMDSPEQVREFVENNDYDFEFVFGEQFARDLGVQSIPYKVYVDPAGGYVKSVLGTQGPDLDYENTKEVIEEYL